MPLSNRVTAFGSYRERRASALDPTRLTVRKSLAQLSFSSNNMISPSYICKQKYWKKSQLIVKTEQHTCHKAHVSKTKFSQRSVFVFSLFLEGLTAGLGEKGL